jgi:hypothetical protein
MVGELPFRNRDLSTMEEGRLKVIRRADSPRGNRVEL